MDWVRWLIGWPDREPAQALAGKVVLLTGASSGIGREIALQLGRVGARLVLASRDNAALLQLRSQIINSEHAGRQVEQPAVLGLDLADLPSLQSRAEEALAVWGKLDILLHCAGQTVRAAALDTELAVYQQLLAVNFLGCCELTRVCGAALKESRGQVAVVGSVQGLLSPPHRAAYTASKHAVQAWADCLRAELAAAGVGVLVVCPAHVNTALSQHAVTGAGQQWGQADPATLAGYSPDWVAGRVVAGLANRSSQLVLAPLHIKLVILLRTLWPDLYRAIMRWKAARDTKKR